MKQKILFIHKGQFGRDTDSYKWCCALKKEYDVTCICFDGGYKKVIEDGILVKYVSLKGFKLLRGLRFLLYVLWNMLWFDGKIVVVFFPGCHIFKKILPWKKMLLDVRTLSISRVEQERVSYDANVRRAVMCYNIITIISQGILDKLKLPQSKLKNCYIATLGADILSTKDKIFDKLDLLYVGTLNHRDLEKTIYGFAEYIKRSNDYTAKYHIVGDGKYTTVEELKQIAYDELHLNDSVIFYGRVPYLNLKQFYDDCNIGISFVPMTPWYDYQPVTKTYEYVLSGLYTIGTATYCNKEAISEKNGILINDTIHDFADALLDVKNGKGYNSSDIRRSLIDFTWDKVLQDRQMAIKNL